MNNSETIKQSAFDAAMCAVPAIMPRLMHTATVELESDLFGLVALDVNYYHVPADAESGAEATIDLSTIWLRSLRVDEMLTNDTMDTIIDEILGSA